MPATRGRLLDQILRPDAISVVFQGIHALAPGGWVVWGHEGLVRGPRGTNVEAPDVLFDYARRCNQLRAIELMSLRRVLEEAAVLPSDKPVFINVTAATLEGVRHLPWLLAGISQECGIPTSRMCVELTEQEPIRDRNGLREALLGLRELGIRFAIDDFGNGYGTLELLTLVPPDFVKVGDPLVRGVGGDRTRRQLLRWVVEVVEGLSAAAIAECVETKEDLAAVADAGVHLAQGYLLGRPTPVQHVAAHGVVYPGGEHPATSPGETPARDIEGAGTRDRRLPHHAARKVYA